MSTADPLRQILDGCLLRLRSSAYFTDIALLPMVRDTTAERIGQQLAAAFGANGKAGAAVMAMLPTLDVDAPNAPGPQFDVIETLLVVVHAEINASSIGTGKHAGTIAREVCRHFHHTRTSSLIQLWNANRAAIAPATEFAGNLEGWYVSISSKWAQSTPPRCATPTVAVDGSQVTLSCATAGAALYYTLDGTYPGSGNPAATLYTAPFTQAAAAEIAVGAELTGLQPSSVHYANLSI